MIIEITIKKGKTLINGKPYEKCNETEKRFFNETLKGLELTKKTEVELTVEDYE